MAQTVGDLRGNTQKSLLGRCNSKDLLRCIPWDAESRELSSAGKNDRPSSTAATLLLRGKVEKKQDDSPHFGRLCGGARTMVVRSILNLLATRFQMKVDLSSVHLYRVANT